MWFSPLKGAHLTLGQLDKTLPVDLSATATVGSESNVKLNTTIERGTFVFIKAGTNGTDAPRFQRYTSTEAGKPNAVPYIALMGVYDFQAGMAGTVGQVDVDGAIGADAATDSDGNTISAATGNAATFLDPAASQAAVKGPRITAISVVQPAEYQTSAFDTTQSYYVGQPLTVDDNGVLTPFRTGKNIVGYVTARPFTRWINDLGASATGARISGGNKKVIEFSTAWIPVSATSTATTPGDSDTVKPLNVKAPAAAPAAAKPATPAK